MDGKQAKRAGEYPPRQEVFPVNAMPKEAKSALMARFLGRKIKFIKQTN